MGFNSGIKTRALHLPPSSLPVLRQGACAAATAIRVTDGGLLPLLSAPIRTPGSARVRSSVSQPELGTATQPARGPAAATVPAHTGSGVSLCFAFRASLRRTDSPRRDMMRMKGVGGSLQGPRFARRPPDSWQALGRRFPPGHGHMPLPHPGTWPPEQLLLRSKAVVLLFSKR